MRFSEVHRGMHGGAQRSTEMYKEMHRGAQRYTETNIDLYAYRCMEVQ